MDNYFSKARHPIQSGWKWPTFHSLLLDRRKVIGLSHILQEEQSASGWLSCGLLEEVSQECNLEKHLLASGSDIDMLEVCTSITDGQ